MDYFSEIVRKVFQYEESQFINWLQRHKVFAWAASGTFLALYIYIQWGTDIAPGIRQFFSRSEGWLIWILFVWLALLTAYLYRREKVWNESEFKDDFRHGLENWEFYGTWKTEREDDQRILIVSNSDAGGYVKKCRLWNDYLFEFETKIIHKNSSWIIRATDILNYLMLQCNTKSIVPSLKINGQWIKFPAQPLPIVIPLKEWFRVSIKVTGTRIVVRATLKGEEFTFLDSNILEPQVIATKINKTTPDQEINIVSSLPLGSIGFREAGLDCAHFRNIRVTKISIS